MKRVTWNSEKAALIRADKARGNVGFEECAIAIEQNDILAQLPNPNFSNQQVLVLKIYNYAYAVPFVETEDEIFLKTVFPSRKYAAQYLTPKHHG